MARSSGKNDRANIKNRPVINNGSPFNIKRQKESNRNEYLNFLKDKPNVKPPVITKQSKDETKDNLIKNLKSSNEIITQRALETGNPLLMRQAAITENFVLKDKGVYTNSYADASSVVADALSGKYSHGISQTDWDKWYLSNTYVVKRKDPLGNDVSVRMLKSYAAPPPIGYDENGNTVDISSAWRYFQQVDYVRSTREERKAKYDEDMKSMYADHYDEDMDTYNSYLDAFIGLITGHGLEGYKSFYSQYILKPLKYGNFSALGLNILNDLGETLDLLPRGVKALASSQTLVYGQDTHFTSEEGTAFTNQKYWVYSGGEKKQKALMDLGAMDIINATRYTQGYRDEAITKIKEAGLWEDFLQFQEEYNSDYDSGGISSAFKALKEAYTTHKVYDANTGSLAADLILELLSDPTILVGLAKGVGKGVLKGVSENAVTTALSVAGKEASALDEVTGLTVNSLAKRYMDDLLSKGDDEIAELSHTISKELETKGVFDTYGAEKFRNELISKAKEIRDETAFTVVKSLYYADSTMNAIDTTLLKNVFVAPYLTAKTVVPLAKKGAEIGTLKYQVMKKAFINRVFKGAIDAETGHVDIMSADAIIKRLETEYLPKEHPEIIPEAYEMIRRSAEHHCNKIDSIITKDWDSIADMDKEINDYIVNITKGEYQDFAGFVHHIEKLNEAGTMDDLVDLVKRQYEKYTENRMLMNEGYGTLYKKQVVSGKRFEPPVVAKDKLIDKSKRLSGGLKKEWRSLCKKYAESLSDSSPYKIFFDSKRNEAPTLKETVFILQEFLKEYSYRLVAGESVDFSDVLQFYNKVIQTELSVDVQKHLQFNMFQKDKWAAFEEATSNSHFKKVLDSFTDPSSNVSKMVNEFLQKVPGDLPEGVSKSISEMIEQLKCLDAFQTLHRKLDLNHGPLSDDQVYRVLDSVFNRDHINPNALTDVTGKEMDTLIEKVNIGLAALDDVESFALDNFRRAAIYFESDIWSKYASEISDPAIQKRVRDMLAGGHEDPMADVRVQMLQVILRDKDAIARYNNMSKQQDVIFYDIETRGMNVDNHEITSVAMKKWETVSEDATLDDILTMLEKEGKAYQTYTAEAVLRESISDDILKVNYKNRADIPKEREAMLNEYCKRFGAETNGTTVTEREMLDHIIYDLDNSFKGRNGQTPILVSHNNNNFDANFIRKRMIENKTFPSHIKDLDSLMAKEQNTYKMLCSNYPESSLSAEQEVYIRRVIADYARDMSKFTSTMRVFEPGKLVSSINYFTKADPELFSETMALGQKELLDFEVDTIQKSFLDSIADDKVVFAISPYHRTVESLDDDAIIKFFGQDRVDEIRKMTDEELREVWLKEVYGRDVQGSDSMMRMIKDRGALDSIPRYGYRTVNVDSVSTYFNVVGQKVPQGALMKINSLAKACNTDITKRLRSNTFLTGHLKEFQTVINYVKTFADDLDVYDDLYYLRYVKAPESIEEAYVMAQRLWDTFTGTVKYEDAMKYIKEGTPLEKIPEDVRGTVVSLIKFKDTFDIGAIVSPEVKAILSDEGKMYHHQIFKDVKNAEAVYLNQIKENELIGDAIVKKCTNDERALTTMSILSESNKATKTKDAMIGNLLRRSREAIEHYLGMDKAAKEIFQKECDDAVSKMMDAQTAQVMKFISQSEENLLAHLLFHNQVLVIPTSGSKLHMTQLNDLNKVLSQESEMLYHTVDNQGYLWIGIKKEWQERIQIKNDAAHVANDTELSFHGIEGVYTPPKYGRIAMPEGALSDETLAGYFKHTEEQVLHMSRGASAGSLGIAHTISKQRNLYANAPKGFIDNTLDIEFTCNERFWHNANYDMSLLGGMAERWKVGSQNDIDYLLATRQTLEETAKKAQAERMFVQGIWGAQERLRIKDIFSDGATNREIAQAFKENSDIVCVSLRESTSTESGFYVQLIDTTTAQGVKQAINEDAIIIPYSMYSPLGDVINMSKASTGFLKVYSQLVHMYKVGYLFSPGTWIRNFTDATMKAIGDTGDPIGLLGNYMNAMQIIRKYKKTVETISKARGVSHNTMADLERCWDDLKTDLTFDEFKFMDEWMRRDESGGESNVLKIVKEHRARQNGVANMAREANDGRDLIDDSLFKFELIPEMEARKLFRKTELDESIKMTEDEFADIFSKRVVPTQARRMEYESAAKLVMNQTPSYKHTLGSAYQTLNDKMLCPMSAIEEAVRLGEFMTLEKQGLTQSDIFHRITKSQFNYNLKSPMARKMELVIPFYTFMHENMIYWCKQISENPRMLRYIEKIWGELSWDTADYSEDELIYNYSLQYAMLSGNIPISDTGFMFKLNLSCLDAFKISYSPLERLYNGLFQPIQNIVQDNLRGSDARLLFGEQTFWSDNKNIVEVFQQIGESDTPVLDIAREAPVIGPLIERMFVTAPGYVDRLPDGVPIQKFLTRAFPSVFGVIKNYKKSPEFLPDDLSWDELVDKMARDGEFWDANQKEFVTMDNFIPGGLNREFDFDKEGEWDEYCAYRKKYLGEVWDNNIQEFVQPEDLTVGGLNDPDATWEEVLYYNGRLGKFYNHETGKFVDINEWPLEEQKVLRYTFFGEKYDEESKTWVQVADPMKGFGTNVEVTVTEHDVEEEAFLLKVGIIATAYAANPDLVRTLVRTPSKYFEASQKELDTFMSAMEKIGLGGYTNTSSSSSPRVLPNYNRRPHNNKMTVFTRHPQVKKGSAVYNKPYVYGSNAGLRMATSGDPAYDTFYNYDYIYSYKFRNPQRGVADFPQSKLGIQRYMRLRTDALTRKLRLRAEFNVDNSYSLKGVTPSNRLQGIKLHWWMR